MKGLLGLRHPKSHVNLGNKRPEEKVARNVVLCIKGRG
jgi:hypothetical protein